MIRPAPVTGRPGGTFENQAFGVAALGTRTDAYGPVRPIDTEDVGSRSIPENHDAGSEVGLC